MAVKIRLMRFGAKKNPYYRVVVADSHSPRDGKFIEILGQYDPNVASTGLSVNEEKAVAWMQKGAQPTDTVRSLFNKQGIMKKWEEAKTNKA